ncbi:MAG TPA: transcription antitermination factor NusB [Treponemataceae bacterium]|nr:transcription antitermination factor NusB [Treponemataceae bacterium]
MFVTRRNSRIIAFQAMYSQEVGKFDIDTIMKFEWLDEDQKVRLDDETRIFIRMLLTGTIENLEAIDKMISTYLKHWSIDRLSKVDLSILRISAYPLMYQQDIAPSIIIDEAIDISKKFSSDDSYKFVNAVLDNIRKDVLKSIET